VKVRVTPLEASLRELKDKNGQTPPLEEFAHFKCFDEKGSVTFAQKGINFAASSFFFFLCF
jgi:hypothetical protein